ncbi:YihY/virulence factor BrkB family protein [Roseomonas sp. CAU 1739]|uniref:YihY/virulence factor BrkB family protein n=1 Tax=Roseomonas sp. CAU 1739 TaxID=3140364 RepID=UPI00325AFEDC
MTGRRLRAMIVDALRGFIADECLSRAASIAYFTLFSLSPLLVIAVAIAGAAFGEDAARGAVQAQLRDLLGPDAAEAIQAAIRGAADTGRGTLAGAIGLGVLLLTASGTFGEIQSALNAVWKTEVPPTGGVSQLLKAKAAAIGLVAATGFLLLTSLVASAAIAALGSWMQGRLPGSAALIEAVNTVVSLLLLSALFGAIYKVLPDRRIAWGDVAVGALITALLFTVGKSAIGLYIGGAGIAGSFGAAGSLAAVLVWIYYSALIFLFGAEITRAWANREGSRQAKPVPAVAAPAPPKVIVVDRPAVAPLGAISATLAAVVGVLMLRRRPQA